MTIDEVRIEKYNNKKSRPILVKIGLKKVQR